jgi:hypothetical protein
VNKDELQTLAYNTAVEAGIDPWLFIALIDYESLDWSPESKGEPTQIKTGADAGEWVQAMGIAQILPRYHPKEGQQQGFWEGDLDPMNPQQALKYSALLLRSHIRHQLKDPTWKDDPNKARTDAETEAIGEALADYNVGRWATSEERSGDGANYAAEVHRRVPILQATLVHPGRRPLKPLTPPKVIGSEERPGSDGPVFEAGRAYGIAADIVDQWINSGFGIGKLLRHVTNFYAKAGFFGTEIAAAVETEIKRRETLSDPAFSKTQQEIREALATTDDPESEWLQTTEEGDFDSYRVAADAIIASDAKRTQYLQQVEAMRKRVAEHVTDPDLRNVYLARLDALEERISGAASGWNDRVDTDGSPIAGTSLAYELQSQIGALAQAVPLPEPATTGSIRSNWNELFQQRMDELALQYRQGQSARAAEDRVPLSENPDKLRQHVQQASLLATQAVQGMPGGGDLTPDQIRNPELIFSTLKTGLRGGLDQQTIDWANATFNLGRDIPGMSGEGRVDGPTADSAEPYRRDLMDRIRDKDDPMDKAMAMQSFGYVVDALRALNEDPGKITPEQLRKEEEILAGFVGLSPDQARQRAADLIKSRMDVRKLETEEEQARFLRTQGLETSAEARALAGREEQIGVRTDIRELQQRQQEQQTGVSRAMAAAQQQLASEYLGHAPQFGPVTPGAKIGGANIYEHLGRTLEERSRGAYPTQEEALAALPVGTLDPGYLPYGGPVPRVPQASDMQAWQEALASARAKVAYQTEAQTLAGLPQYTPVPGVSAPAAAAVVQPTRRYNPALDLF